MATQVTLNSGAVSSTGSLKLQTNGTTDAVTFDTAQNMGLGVAPSAWSVGKAFEMRNAGNAVFTNGAGEMYLSANAYYNGGWLYGVTGGYAAQYICGNTNGTHIWKVASASGTAGNPITFTQAMTLDASGNLGIGTSSPARKLDVVGGAIGVASTSAGGYITNVFENSSSSGYVQLQYNVGAAGANGQATVSYAPGLFFAIGPTANDTTTPIVFRNSNATERMRIDSSGNLLVGTTSSDARFIVVNPNSGKPTAWVQSTFAGDVSQAAIYVVKQDNNSTTSQIFQKFYINNGGAASGQIVANGANAAAFASTSDQRVKENIVDLPPQLDKVMNLRPVEFDYIESLGGGHQIGFIAQEMQQVFPDAVSADDSEDQILSVTGWSKTEAILVKAIQEQQAIIQQLQADVAALKG